MLVVRVQMRDFRTYARAEASVGPGLTVVHGPNGAGKSNLLEAIYYGCTARPLRTRNERQLIRFGAQATRVVLSLAAGDRHHELTVAFGASGEGGQPVKRTTADGVPVERMLDVQERPLLSVFMPDRLGLVKGAPALRRAHLDQLTTALWPQRASLRADYSRVLAQRNALLGRVRAGRASRQNLAVWDLELARRALTLAEHRAAAVLAVGPELSGRAERLGCGGGLTLAYRPRSAARGEEEFCAELREHLPADIERGFTGHGPHRDDLALLRDGRELRVYGSQGEQRLALLALLLSERSVIARERGRMPLMLLDDVMSELDAERRELLAGDLARDGQSVIATTELAGVPGAGNTGVTRLRISPGIVLQEAIAA